MIQLKTTSKLQAPVAVKSIHIAANGNDIGCYCPKCNSLIEFRSEWPIDIPITCGVIQNDKSICGCRFIITNETPIED